MIRPEVVFKISQMVWCLVISQVEDVDAKFAALEKLKENSWQEEEKKTKKVARKPKAKVRSVLRDEINACIVTHLTYRPARNVTLSYKG